MSKQILETFALGFPWATQDPFLFCVYHQDFYPQGNGQFGPQGSLIGRQMGQDFTIKDGWRMYHGSEIPGFPGHPHRGFETITVVKQGWIDHADSLGAAGRYGAGDVQWMTAGKGIQHSEMFPLLSTSEPNTLELFQIWLNLPAAHKMVEPHFKMLWRENIPKYQGKDDQGNTYHVEIIAGQLANLKSPGSPPHSWAANPQNEVAVWTIQLAPNCRWLLPQAGPDLNRTLYYYQGKDLEVAGETQKPLVGLRLASDQDILLENGKETSYLLLLQGRPIRERVAQYGPFVMNTKAEIVQAFEDYQATQFGGWPWPSSEPVHGDQPERFARHANGEQENP